MRPPRSWPRSRERSLTLTLTLTQTLTLNLTLTQPQPCPSPDPNPNPNPDPSPNGNQVARAKLSLQPGLQGRGGLQGRAAGLQGGAGRGLQAPRAGRGGDEVEIAQP